MSIISKTYYVYRITQGNNNKTRSRFVECFNPLKVQERITIVIGKYKTMSVTTPSLLLSLSLSRKTRGFYLTNMSWKNIFRETKWNHHVKVQIKVHSYSWNNRWIYIFLQFMIGNSYSYDISLKYFGSYMRKTANTNRQPFRYFSPFSCNFLPQVPELLYGRLEYIEITWIFTRGLLKSFAHLNFVEELSIELKFP